MEMVCAESCILMVCAESCILLPVRDLSVAITGSEESEDDGTGEEPARVQGGRRRREGSRLFLCSLVARAASRVVITDHPEGGVVGWYR